MPNASQIRRRGQPDMSLAEAPIACHQIDLEGKVVWVNAAECRLLGLDEADLLGRPVWEFVAPEEQDASRPAVARKLAGDEQLVNFERTLVRPDGSRLAIEIHENYLRDKTGAVTGIRSFLIDITERRRAEEALRKVQENLELRIHERTQELELAVEFLRREIEERGLAEREHRKLEAQVQLSQRLESMGVLAGGVAHEFNNLLTSIMGYASLAAMDMAENSRARNNVDQVLLAAKSAADLTQQMLAYSGRGKFILEKLDVGKLIEGTARLLDSMVGKKVTLRRNLAAALPRIEADSSQVRQVVINLTANAADALGDRSGDIEISTGVMWAEGGELPSLQAGRVLCAGLYVYIEVRDTGCGMDAETQARIFDPFFTTKFTGRGLGLAAVLGIIRGHRGSIQVTSKVGEGTIFRVLFPAKEEWNETALSEPEALEWRGEGVVLVVEDEESIRKLASTILGGIGLTVLTAADGNQAIEIFRAHAGEIQTVLLDLTMPGMDGVEVFHHIRGIRPEVKVILCSGYNEQEVSVRLRGERPNAFLRKPYDLRELMERVKAVW